MDVAAIRKLLDRLTGGEIDADEVVRHLRSLPYTEMGYATIDTHRELRQGAPEAVYGPGKSPDHCVGIVGELLSSGDGPVLLSRATSEQIDAVTARFTGAEIHGGTVVWRRAPSRAELDPVPVVTAGTADLPVADECVATLQAMGIPTRLMADLGVAGLHRLLDRVPELQRAPAVVVVAGMEGALSSV